MLKYFIELEIEEEWFDKNLIPSIYLINGICAMEQCLNKTPHSHVEGVLRHSIGLKENWVAFGKLSGYFLSFVVVAKDLMTILFQSF